MQPKVLFIDWDGTLSNTRFWARWSAESANLSKNRAIQQALFSSNGHAMLRDWMLGFVAYPTVLAHLELVTSIPYKELESELRYSCEHMQFAEPNTIETVQALRQNGMKIVIATDNMDVFRLWTVPTLGQTVLFDGILTSDSRGAMKATLDYDGRSPFFGHYLSQNGLQPNETVLIDNSPDTRIVENLGMHFLLVDGQTPLSQHLAEFTTTKP